MNDTISRQQTITALRALSDEDGYINAPHEVVTDVVRGLPPVRAKQGQTVHLEQNKTDKLGVKTGETCEDCISRQAAIDALHMHLMYRMGTDSNKKRLDDWINGVPSVQPERTCVNCGRTVNNGGWYADGRTRCPIEEHYALPKDGYCYLWEKRNITDDDYPRRTDKQTPLRRKEEGRAEGR